MGRSVRYLRESVSVTPNAEAMGLLAFGLAMRGEERDAMQFARRAMAIDPLSPAVTMFVMGAAWHANAATQALAWADAARRVAPDNPTVQYLAGYLLVVTGQRDPGLTLLDQAAASEEGTVFQVMPRMLGQALRGESVPLLAGCDFGPSSRETRTARTSSLKSTRRRVSATRHSPGSATLCGSAS